MTVDAVDSPAAREPLRRLAAIAHSEWLAYSQQVSDWERSRYLATS